MPKIPDILKEYFAPEMMGKLRPAKHHDFWDYNTFIKGGADVQNIRFQLINGIEVPIGAVVLMDGKPYRLDCSYNQNGKLIECRTTRLPEHNDEGIKSPQIIQQSIIVYPPNNPFDSWSSDMIMPNQNTSTLWNEPTQGEPQWKTMEQALESLKKRMVKDQEHLKPKKPERAKLENVERTFEEEDS